MTNAEYRRHVRIETTLRKWLKDFEKAEHDDPPATLPLYAALRPATDDV